MSKIIKLQVDLKHKIVWFFYLVISENMQPDCFEKISYSSGINFANVSSMFTIQTTLHFGGGGG